MNDEKFELTISDLAGSGTYYADIADELRARDTAQREALEQLRTERRHDAQIQSAMAADQKAVADALGIPSSEYSGGVGEQLLAIAKLREERDIAQAQLAEMRRIVAGFLFNYDDGVGKPWERRLLDYSRKLVDAKEFNAQAEQQEAQGAQAGDEQRECCNEECGWKGSTDRVLSGHGKVPDVGPLCPECGETTERAALATQPAEQADDELSARPAEGEWIEWGGNGTHAPFDEMLGADIRFRDGVEFSPPAVIGLRWNHAGNDKDIIAYRLHKPAVRGAEHE